MPARSTSTTPAAPRTSTWSGASDRQARRSNLLYAMAQDQGLVHGESLLADAPQAFSGYEPGNFQAAFTGPVSVSGGLAAVAERASGGPAGPAGPQAFQAQLRSGGVRLRMAKGEAPNPGLILGGAGNAAPRACRCHRRVRAASAASQVAPADPRVEPG